MTPPILTDKDYAAPSVFDVDKLLREARRQKRLPDLPVPRVCVLDPDGDLVEHLRAAGRSERHRGWGCYHTDLEVFTLGDQEVGVVGRAVGSSFAVLVAEELFASGCILLISVTSAGQIQLLGDPPYFMLIDRALRDEGTSYHYLPPARYSRIDPALQTALWTHWDQATLPLHCGSSWTTDAPFRETESALASRLTEGVAAVEMEAAALYALAEARRFAIVCFAHITNDPTSNGEDFEKGPAQGATATLAVITEAMRCLAVG
ncbi:MAG: nucleoside phosphorylase [Anaerolineales bacterium]|nr:nucleoside phosphorylase [Anaerolineales bacterium]